MLGRKKIGFGEAFKGLRTAWQEELNFNIQIALGILTVLAGWFFEIAAFEWLALIIVIGIVLSAEVFNTALEELCDKFKTDPDPHIAKIKDLSAGAVLIASAAALIVGIIIFAPRLALVLA